MYKKILVYLMVLLTIFMCVSCSKEVKPKTVNIDFDSVYGSDIRLKNSAKNLINKQSPKIQKLKDMNGVEIDLSNISKKTVIMFISTKSSIWKESVIMIEKEKEKHPDIDFIQFYMDENKSYVIKQLNENGITDLSNIISCDDNSLLPSTALAIYGIYCYPTFVFINETNIVSYFDIGQLSENRMENFLLEYLN